MNTGGQPEQEQQGHVSSVPGASSSATGTTTWRHGVVATGFGSSSRGATTTSDLPFYPCQFQVPSTYSPLSGQEDLLSKFNLTSIYGEFVQPYLPTTTTINTSTTEQSSIASLKGKSVSFVGKPEKRFHEWIIDVGGYCPPRPDRDPQRQSLAALFRPDYAPLAPVDQNAVDDDEIRAAFGGFAKGDLEGWEQSVWETSDNPHQKKKKKRRQHHSSQQQHHTQTPAESNTPNASLTHHAHAQNVNTLTPSSTTTRVKISLKSNLAHSLSSPIVASEDEHRKKKRRKE